MNPLVVVTHCVPPEIVTLLRRNGLRVLANDTRESWPRSTLLKHAALADALMAFMPDRIDDALLASCPKLKVVGAALKGFDNIDVAACTRRTVRVTFVPELLTAPAAELTVGMMIALARHVLAGDRRVRARAYKGWRPVLYGGGLEGETVGLLGMGAIGQAIARRLSGFGVKLICHDAQRVPVECLNDLKAVQVSFNQVLMRSAYVIVALPLNDATLHAVDGAALKRMKKGAYLINIGRGSVVDEAAVASALTRGSLGGYAADVFEFEDLSRTSRPDAIPKSLLSAPNTLFLPHLGSAVEHVRHSIALSAARSIVAVLKGQRPSTCVNA